MFQIREAVGLLQMFFKIVFLNISQILQEKSCVRVPFFTKKGLLHRRFQIISCLENRDPPLYSGIFCCQKMVART